MTVPITFQEFKQKYQLELHPLFKKLNLDSEIKDSTIYTASSIIHEEIVLAQENLLKLGSEDKIREIYLILCYCLALPSYETKAGFIKDIKHNHLYLDKFFAAFISNVKFAMSDEEEYAAHYHHDLSFKRTALIMAKFIDLLDEVGFDHQDANLSKLFLIPFWIKLEMILLHYKGNLKVEDAGEFKIYHLFDKDPVRTSSLNILILKHIKECLECINLFKEYGRIILFGKSPIVINLQLKAARGVITRIQKKGATDLSSLRKLESEAMEYFWDKCIEMDPKLSKKYFLSH